jgi:hypothetical protein
VSGGSYNYLCHVVEAEELFAKASQLQDMAERLAGLGWAEDAAKDAYDLLAILQTQRVRIEAAIDRLRVVFSAVEWWDSNDSGEDAVRKALAEYRGES